MTKVRLLIRIVAITIVIIFLMACITAGVFLLMYHFDVDDYVPNAVWENFWGVCYVCYDFGQDLYAAARYYCWPYPPSDNWIECRKVKYVQRYLRNEKVKKIAFRMIDFEKGEIVEPEKINRVLQLIGAVKKERELVITCWGRMVIVTDKHKFTIPVRDEDKAICGLDWKSEGLHKQLWEWGYGYIYKYYLPSKEETIAILLLYPHHYDPVHPLALFGDEKLAKEIMFGVWINDKEGKRIRIGFNKYAEEFKPKKVFEGRDWLEKIMDAYEIALKEAKERERYYPMEFNPVGSIVFMTQDGSYWKEIGIDANTVFDDYIKSEQLKTCFDEIGLTKELLAGAPNKAPKN